MNEKPISIKPMFYSVVLEPLKIIAKEFGYNLVLHGSMNRDLDLILIPWIDHCHEPDIVVKALTDYLGGNLIDQRTGADKEPQWSKPIYKGAGRMSYLISLNRSNRFSDFKDDEFYIDISLTPKDLQIEKMKNKRLTKLNGK